MPFDKQLIRVPRMEAEAWELSLNNQAEILFALCRECDEPIAAIPEWWQTRLGAERPQLIIQYAAMFDDGTFDKAKYSISIPYWNKSKEQTEINDFPIYRKGQYMAQLILRDNSKVIVNCFSEDVCDDVIDKLSQSINPNQLDGSAYTTSRRLGRELNKIVVYPRVAKFFSTGQMDITPDWVKKL